MDVVVKSLNWLAVERLDDGTTDRVVLYKSGGEDMYTS